ncbi:MBOAT family O-acyltransferase [Zunongwangia sp. F363]|uniref:MBOAT family O-acyltransferase n=1 Tax=Autumnicola tepida TaxID=3075595 RepID=A0ABU3C925_9FLAO|nr:MBOAT family O-acyltransferase [Zunongwangia sp. F363]MDT0642845.1 MBOAT family O-acyltransferase [Zunongwangia sp. F363]
MLFNSLEFAIFLPVVFLLYWSIGSKQKKLQNYLILAASYFFYGYWDWRFLFLILFSSLIDYWAGIAIYRTQKENRKKWWLFFSVFWNLGVLFVFKYFNFFIENFLNAFNLDHNGTLITSLSILLPVGLSFYTFQTLSYTIDVYKKRIKPTNKLLEFLCFVSFFPQLVAGPVERASFLLPQFLNKRIFNSQKAKEGLRQILWGLFKKIVVADNLVIAVNEMYSNPERFQSLELFYIAVLYYFQLYCDFSGYVDIAIGTAKLFGFNLSVNFRMPHLSRSIRDFWRRWNITLSQWFRDYLYIPFVKQRPRTEINTAIGLFITFTLIGFWHGANWNFLVFGAIHSILVIIYRYIPEVDAKNFRNHFRFRFADITGTATSFFILIITLIIFRTPELSLGFKIIGDIFSFIPDNNFETVIGMKVLFILLLLGIELPNRHKDFPLQGMERFIPRIGRWLIYYSFIYLIIRYAGPQAEYIYFQF